MSYARGLSGSALNPPDQNVFFAGVKRPPRIPSWAWEEVETGMPDDTARALVAFGAEPKLAAPFLNVLQKERKRMVRCPDGRTVPARPPNTKLYIPGYLSDMDQDKVDMEALDMIQDGFGIAPVVIAAASKGVSLIHGSSTGKSNAATDAAANQARAGDASGLALVIKQGGFTSNGGWRGAVGKGADAYARQKLNDLINEGVAIGPLVRVDSWRYTLPDGRPSNNPNNWRLSSGKPPAVVGAPGTTTPGWVATPPPAPMPTGIMAPGGGVQNPVQQALAPIINMIMPSSPATTAPDQAVLPPTPGSEVMPEVASGPAKAGMFDLGGLTKNPMLVMSIVGISLFLMANKRR